MTQKDAGPRGALHRTVRSGQFVTASGRRLMVPVGSSRLSAFQIDQAVRSSAAALIETEKAKPK